MNNIDIKYLNVPNICFSMTKPDDEREIDFIEQRLKRGFDVMKGLKIFSKIFMKLWW